MYDNYANMRPQNHVFETQYQCFSMAIIDKSHLDDGDKILLPPSALNTLSRMEVEFPMLFELRNDRQGKKTHCGVTEFTAEEGKCHLPFFMMQNLMIEEGSIINVKNISLPKATFLKVQAQSVDFLDISNPRAVLEFTLRKYTCVTEGDQLVLPHLGKFFFLNILEVKPNGAASIVETDVEIDFAEPIGYQDSEYARRERGEGTKAGGDSASSTGGGVVRTLQKATASSAEPEEKKFEAFGGAGKRIDGKPLTKSGEEVKSDTVAAAAPAPAPTPAQAPKPAYQSRIGDKFSKKKNSASAFSGAARKLT